MENGRYATSWHVSEIEMMLLDAPVDDLLANCPKHKHPKMPVWQAAQSNHASYDRDCCFHE